MRTIKTNDREGSAVLCECDMCGREFQFGPHRYAGHRIPAWDAMACDGCLDRYDSTIVPGSYPRLEAHLKRRGIKPEMDSSGWIVIPR